MKQIKFIFRNFENQSTVHPVKNIIFPDKKKENNKIYIYTQKSNQEKEFFG